MRFVPRFVSRSGGTKRSDRETSKLGETDRDVTGLSVYKQSRLACQKTTCVGSLNSLRVGISTATPRSVVMHTSVSRTSPRWSMSTTSPWDRRNWTSQKKVTHTGSGVENVPSRSLPGRMHRKHSYTTHSRKRIRGAVLFALGLTLGLILSSRFAPLTLAVHYLNVWLDRSGTSSARTQTRQS